MAKKTEKEKDDIQLNLEIQMNIATDLARRNPKLKNYPNKCFDRFGVEAAKYPTIEEKNDFDESLQEEFDKIFNQIYGEIFPSFPWPVIRVEEYEQDPSELILRIDLNYTKEEIMFNTEGWVGPAIKEYRKNYSQKIKRKVPRKWQTYIEIWDLKNGDPPWFDAGDGLKAPRAKTKVGRPWTYEEIAKYIYPDMQAPEQLKSAIDKVKKDYRAAYKLICGEEYKPEEIKTKINKLDPGFCSNCPDQRCKETGEVCPPVFEELERIQVKRSESLISKQQHSDIERFKRS